MIKIYGASDDLIEINNSCFEENEIDCFDKDVRIFFDDGAVIKCGYGKGDLGIWAIHIEKEGTAKYILNICDDENAEIYSDIFETDAEVVSYEYVE